MGRLFNTFSKGYEGKIWLNVYILEKTILRFFNVSVPHFDKNILLDAFSLALAPSIIMYRKLSFMSKDSIIIAFLLAWHSTGLNELQIYDEGHLSETTFTGLHIAFMHGWKARLSCFTWHVVAWKEE